MNVLRHLTVESLCRNKRRTIVTIIGVMLSSALILAVVGMVTSFQKMMINFTITERGNYHEMFQEVPVEALQYIENNHHVASYYYSAPLDTTKLDEDTLNTYTTYQHAPYKAEFYQRLDALPENATGKYNIFVRYDTAKDYETVRNNIVDVIAKESGETINYRTNSDLLRYEFFAMSDTALTTLYSLAMIVIGIIVVTSVLVIRNSFSISATERARQFGMLSSVGATPRQIRHSIIFEGLVIAAIGIPLGILLGVAAVAILVVVVNALLGDMLEAAVEFSMPLWIFPTTIFLSLITILLSSLMPAIRAARMSPIEAIRGNQDIKMSPRKLHTSKFVQKIFGIGGVIADKNLKRSRKKYRTTVISIVLSVATFVGLYSFMGYGKSMVGLEYGNSKIDFAMQGGDVSIYHDLTERFHLKQSAYYLSHSSSATIPIYAMEETAFRNFAKSVGVDQKDLSQVALLNDQAMNQREDGGYAIERLTDVRSGDNYNVNIAPEPPEKCVTYEDIDSERPGTSYQVHVDDKCLKAEHAEPYDVTLKISKVIDQYPLGFEDYHAPMIIIPTNYYRLAELSFDKNYSSQFFAAEVDDVNAITTYLDQYFKTNQNGDQYYYTNVKEGASQMRRLYLLISIFLYGFIIVVTLIGVTNIFNTITTNIALRAKEFAMLKSIGMTSKEFNRMVRLESLMYAGKALIIGLPLGLLLSYAFYQSIANSVDFGFIFPWGAVVISIVAVGVLIGAIMHYSVRQVEKQNIIETIRAENI